MTFYLINMKFNVLLATILSCCLFAAVAASTVRNGKVDSNGDDAQPMSHHELESAKKNHYHNKLGLEKETVHQWQKDADKWVDEFLLAALVNVLFTLCKINFFFCSRFAMAGRCQQSQRQRARQNAFSTGSRKSEG